MNSDAREAALGLLGLSPLNAPSHPQPQPHVAGPSLTSPSVGIALDRTSAPHIFQSALPPSLVPLKRKQPSPALSPTTRDPKPRLSHPLASSSTPPIPTTSQHHTFSPIISTPPTSQLPLLSPSTLALSDAPPPPDSEAISCICGFTYDDGFSIACDDCSRWCHAACFGIVQGGEVPEFWKCWVCDPAVEVDKERAVKIQKGRLKAMRNKSNGTNGTPASATTNGVAATSAVDDGSGGVGKPISRRRTSPGAERKSRRGSAVAAAIEGSRKKRRASVLSPADPSSPSIPSQPHPGSSRISHPNGITSVNTSPPTPVTFPPDIYPNPSVYAQLLRVAKAWRGVTALNPPSPLIHPPPKTYSDAGYTRVDSQGYRDRYGYAMSPLDNTTPVILDENSRDVYVPRTVLRTDQPVSCSSLPSQYPTCTPAHLRPPSPKLYVASDPSPFSHTSVYPSPPISNYMSPSVPSSSHPRPNAKSPLTPSTNTISSNPNDTIPATTLLAPYTTSIVPSASYLADPLNGYAHLGMAKPQVRLVGGGWDIGLDARSMGGVPDPPDFGEKADVHTTNGDVADNKARWARCGCWPNAVVRPVICSGTKQREMRMRHKAECPKAASDDTKDDGGAPRAVNSRSVPPPMSRMQGQQRDDSSDQDDAPLASDSEADPMTLSFALFALRDLRADEEIVLGWEWDDGHAVHMLPALMESPGMFAPAHLHHLRAQFTSILHALSSTFTTCACGSSTRDCAVRVMESVVEGRWPWPGGEMTSEGSGDESSASGEWDDDGGDIDVEGDGPLDPHPRNWGLGMNVNVDIEMDPPDEIDRRRRPKKRKGQKRSQVGATAVDGEKNASKPNAKKAPDLGPLVGVKRGFKTREKVPMNGGWGGVEIVPSSPKPFPEIPVEDVRGKGKGKARVADDEDDMDIDPPASTTLPPRMRKTWHRPTPAQSEPVQDNPRDHSKRAESWRAHERWRSPNVESPISVEGGGKSGGVKPGSSSGGDGDDGGDGLETEFDTETEADGSDDTRQMPPPPMPASLDPTTVSSLAHAVRSASPRGSIQRDKNGVAATWIPPRTPTPTSGRPSQPPSQGTATPVPPARSPAPLQANNGALPLSTSFPPAIEMQSHPVQSDAPVSVPTVSPSTTFSKLSLHSPDAASPHLSVLFGSCEFTSLSAASASIQCTSDTGALSPPPHRPSKPLHVHPENESPSLSGSLSEPVETQSPDGMRETPAEAQYQQPYSSSPDSRHETQVDVDKKRPANGEAYRVRFASPEVLSGLPRLRTRVISVEATDGEETRSAHDDTMDIDIEMEAGHDLQVSGSPHSQVPSESLPHSVTDVTPAAESMSVDSVSTHSAREPSPPPPPKVKMSLKDFALRKKKQREEELAAKALRSPVTPDGPGPPSSPDLDQRDFASEQPNGHEVTMNGTTEDMQEAGNVTEEKVMGEDNKTNSDTGQSSPQPLRSPTSVPLVLVSTDQTQTMALTAKIEVVDPVLPDDRTADVVSFAPEPPPPPLTTKQASQSTTVDQSIPKSAVSSTPASTSTSSSTSAAHSRSNSVGIPVSASSPDPLLHSHGSTQRPSQEDGEITSSTPPKSFLPPTQPRSFHAVPAPTPSFGSTSSSTARRPVPPLSRSPLPNAPGATAISSRQIPSGPRALRGSMTQPTTTHVPYPPSRPYTSSQYIPRGPSADRDRMDWDRERQWAGRTRGRAGSNGWGR